MRFSTWSSRMSVALAKYWTTCTPLILTSTRIMFKHSWTLLNVCKFQTSRTFVTLSSNPVLHQWKSQHFLSQACWALSMTASWGALFLMMLTSIVLLKPRGLASAMIWTTPKKCPSLFPLVAQIVTQLTVVRLLLKNNLLMAISSATSTVSSTSNKLQIRLITQP